MKFQIVNKTSVQKLIPVRKKNQNKTHGGKSLIIAGRKGYYGASVLAATAAARVGSGYVTLMTDLKYFVVSKHPEFLTLDIRNKLVDFNSYSSIAIGPGLGINTNTKKIILKLIKTKIKNVVLDADALTVIAKENIFPLPSTWILTPHIGELSRLLDISSKTIAIQKEKYIRIAQKKYACTILLKGAETLIASQKMLFSVRNGNSALAKAGTGDVLTGMIVGFLAQGLSTADATKLATYIHGYTSKVWVKSGKDHLSLIATDLLDLIPIAIRKLR